MRYRAKIPYSKNYLKIGYAYGQHINRYWVRVYRFDEDSGQYKTEISEHFVNRDRAMEYFRSIDITKDIPRVEIWGKLKDKPLRMFTYKGLK